MKKLLLALALLLLPSAALAQCNGVFPNNTVCGNVTGANNLPRPTNPSAFLGAAGGSNGQVQVNNGGALGGLTNAQLTALVNPFTSILSGAVPASDGLVSSFLHANGTWGPINIAAPHFVRNVLFNSTFTPDANAVLLHFQIVGGGGGGSGNGSRNTITYSQYGTQGFPSGIGAKSSTVTITNASPAVVTWAAHGLICNDPVYFATTGSLPSPFVAGTIYYVMCDGSVTTNTFQLSTIQFMPPLTCAVFAPKCQTAINTTTTGSGTQTGNGYQYVAFGGSGGGVIGDQAVPGSYARCDSVNAAAGYITSFGLQGTPGENVYVATGVGISGGRGGGSAFYGGGSVGGEQGINLTGGGGAGANQTNVSASGGAGAGAGVCDIWLKPTGSPIPMLCGAAGTGGAAQLDTATITIASPAVITLANHGFFGGTNASVISFTTTGALPTGITAGTSYFVLTAGLTTNTFEISTTPLGSAINTSGTQSGVQSVTSGFAGGNGGFGACNVTQFFIGTL